jgi:hypothetical protein
MPHRTRSTAVAMAVAACLAPAALAAQTLPEKLQIHGYVTQGFAATDSLPIVGITNRGSADYRAAALQMRFAATTKDQLVVQLANRRMGESRLNDVEEQVALQWAYYQRRLPGNLTAKIGRAPMPRGIFNEVRKVGTVLPFYRAPYNFYTESYETVDGAFLRQDARFGGWELESNLFGGRFDYRQAIAQSVYSPKIQVVGGKPTMVGVTPLRDTTVVLDRNGTNAVGGQFWLTTPLQGLRVGAGGTRFELDDFKELAGRTGEVAGHVVQAAVDGNFTRFQLRGEWEQQQTGEFLYTAQYVQAGVKATERLSLNVQREQANAYTTAKPVIVGVPREQTPTSRSHSRYALDHAVGVNFAFRPNVIVKVEGHENRGSNYDRFTTGKPTGKYVIGSLALSF